MTLNRRQILEWGGYAFVAWGAGAMLAPSAAWALEWSDWIGKRHQGGSAQVIGLKGQAQAQADQKPLQLGSKVVNGQEIVVNAGGEALLLLPDGASFKLSGPARLVLEVDAQGGGNLKLLLGGLLGVIPQLKNRAYLVKSSNATLGIKGTVFYKEVFGPQGSDDPRVQPGALAYFCICNGSLAVLPQGQSQPLLQDQAEHHHAHLVMPQKNGIELVPAAFVKGHDDPGINQVIESNPGFKHNRSWLQL